MGKRIRTILCACIAVLSLYSAVVSAQEKRQNRDVDVASAEEQLCGVSYRDYKVKLTDEDPQQGLRRVNTTWYGANHHGKLMSNGEPFDACNPTIVASKIFPKGTRLRLHYRGTIVDVTVVDTSDKEKGADIDVSYAVALYLGIVERGRVRDLQVEVLS